LRSSENRQSSSKENPKRWQEKLKNTNRLKQSRPKSKKLFEGKWSN